MPRWMIRAAGLLVLALMTACAQPMRSDQWLLTHGEGAWKEPLTFAETMRQHLLRDQVVFQRYYEGKRIWIRPSPYQTPANWFHSGPGYLHTATLRQDAQFQSFVAIALVEDPALRHPEYNGWWVGVRLNTGPLAYIHGKTLWGLRVGSLNPSFTMTAPETPSVSEHQEMR